MLWQLQPVCFCWLKRHREPMAGGSSGTVCTSVGAHLLCAVISGPQAFNYIQTQYESSCHFSHLFPFFVMKWFHVHVTEWVTERDRDTMSKPPGLLSKWGQWSVLMVCVCGCPQKKKQCTWSPCWTVLASLMMSHPTSSRKTNNP